MALKCFPRESTSLYSFLKEYNFSLSFCTHPSLTSALGIAYFTPSHYIFAQQAGLYGDLYTLILPEVRCQLVASGLPAERLLRTNRLSFGLCALPRLAWRRTAASGWSLSCAALCPTCTRSDSCTEISNRRTSLCVTPPAVGSSWETMGWLAWTRDKRLQMERPFKKVLFCPPPR